MAVATERLAPPTERASVLDSYHVDSPHLGVSKIETYLGCAYSYYLKYLVKLKTPHPVKAAKGTLIHDVMHKINDDDPDYATPEQVAEQLWASWDEARHLTDDPDNPEAVRDIGEAANVWLPWYMSWRSKQRQIATEEPWLVTIEANELGPDHDAIILRGTIDRIYRQDGETIIGDVKTGARKPTPYQLDRALQPTLYSWAARRQNMHEDAVEILWLRTQEQLRTTRTDEYALTQLRHVVLPVAQQIAAGFFPCNPDRKYGCNYCEFEHVCDVGKAG